MLYIIIAIAVVLGDQLFKKWIVANIALHGKTALIPSILHLTYVQNTGAAFSIFKNNPMFLTVLTSLLAVLLIVFMIKAKLSKFERISLSVIVGGAIGNLIDRLTLGYVVDMFEVEFMNFAVFNVADCFIVVGGILFCILYLLDGIKDEKK